MRTMPVCVRPLVRNILLVLSVGLATPPKTAHAEYVFCLGGITVCDKPCPYVPGENYLCNCFKCTGALDHGPGTVSDSNTCGFQSACVNSGFCNADSDCIDQNNPCDDSVCVATPPSGGGPTLGRCMKRSKCGGAGAPDKVPADHGVCRQPGFGRSGGRKNIGDPIDADTGLTLYGHVDVRLPAVESEFQLTRFYTASPVFWTRYGGTNGLASPFGTNDSDVTNWSHSLFSFVAPTGNCIVAVRRTDGSVIEFTGCSDGFMTGDEEALELGARLLRDAAQNQYTLFDGNRAFVYATSAPGNVLLLTRITDGLQSPQRPAIAEIQYDTSTSCGPIISIVMVGGSSTLNFNYQAVSKVGPCVLSNITSGGETVVTYEYDAQFGLSRAFGPAFDESFTAPLGGNDVFTAASYNGQRVRHEYGKVDGQTRVVALKESVDGHTLALRDSFVGAECMGSTSCLGTRYKYERTGSYVGDGTRTPASPQSYSVDGRYTPAHNFRSTAHSAPDGVSSSTFGSASASPRVASTVTQASAGTQMSTWEVTATSSVPNTVKTQVDEHLRPTELSWVFGVNETPLLHTMTTTSVLDPAKKSVTTYSWDTTKSRLVAQFRSGVTRELQGGQWKNVDRVVATFYRTARACSAGGADPMDRTVEIHGPCFVASTSATTCAPGQRFHIRAIEYDVQPTIVASVTDYPNAEATTSGTSCGNGLSTLFSNHQYAWWNPAVPGTVTTPDGVTTQFSFVGGRLSSVTRGTHEWQLQYDADQPTRVLTPDGYWLVTCFRDYSRSTGCDAQGELGTKPTAVVVADNADGINPSEAVLFSWAADGTLIETKTVDGTGAVRRRESFESTNAGDLTFRALGQAGVAGKFVATFDDAHRMVGFGDEYNQTISAFCGRPPGSTAPISSLCSSVSWDGDRVARIRGAEVGDTCISYDDDGNVSLVESNCGGVKKARGQYRADDFGNSIEQAVSLRGTQTVTTRMAYDAQGNVITRQTPEMEAASVSIETTWDGLGRLLRTERRTSSGLQPLVVQEWDQSSINPCSSWCPVAAACVGAHRRAGRLAYRSDATGETWYNYSESGQLAAEIVRPRFETSCSAARSRTYSYYPDGAPMSVSYAFGRTVTYVRGVGARRPKSVDVSFFGGASWTTSTLIDDIHWKPFGGVEYYRVQTPSSERFASVDYRDGQTAASIDPESCPTGDFLEDSDQTGRTRALVVKRAESLGYQSRTSGAHVFSARYSYSGKELSSTASCLLSGSEVLFDGRVYDHGALALSTRGIGGAHAWGGRSYGLPTPLIGQNTLSPWEEFRTIALDQSVSAWTGYTPPPNMYRELPDFEQCEPDCVRGYRVESVDPITNERQVERRTVDRNGQVVQRRADWGTSSLWNEHLEGDGQLGGLSGVYRWVSNESGSYEYFYDADNRRRIKTYASGAQDEFFFRPASTELLSDVGNSEVYGPQTHPTDDYVWLGGMPVAVVRGRLDAQMQRMEDQNGDCGRNGASITPTGVSVGSACGVYFPVSDPQGRIALVLDGAQRVAGVGESDPYGNVNQIDVAVGSDHPYSPYFHLQRDLVHGFEHTKWASDVTEVRTRLHYFAVDVEPSDDSWLEDSKGQSLTSALLRCGTAGSSPCGEGMGRVTTFWGKPDDSYAEMHVRFRSGPQTATPLYGVSLDRIEYLRSEKDARPWWPPLRLPGQYLDEETGLFENWNRFYDPEVGRYFSPEPLLQEPEYITSMVQRGHGVHAYQYGMSNPVKYTDATGKSPAVIPIAIAVAVGEALVATGVIAAGVYCIGTQCLGDLHWPWEPTRSSSSDPALTSIPSSTTPDDCSPAQMGRGGGGGKGERGRTGKNTGTSNPWKHCRPHPTDPTKIICRDANGKWPVKIKPEGFDEWWNSQ